MKITEKTLEYFLIAQENLNKAFQEMGKPTIDLLGEEIPEEAPKKQPETQQGLLMIRRMFNHRDTTKPDPAERKAYNQLGVRLGQKELYEQIKVMQRFYNFREKKAYNDTDLWRHESVTLIRHWDGTYGKAMMFLKDKPTSAAKKEAPRGYPEPRGDWREMARKFYAGSGVVKEFVESLTWEECGEFMDGDVQKQICENMAEFEKWRKEKGVAV